MTIIRKTCAELGCDLCHADVKAKWGGQCASVPDEYASYFKFKVINPVQVMAAELMAVGNYPSILACSGTGTGKTAIMEMAIVNHIRGKRAGKIIALFPLRSLAAEKMREWSTKFGLKVIELTGDTKKETGGELNKKLYENDIIITSYEMFNSWSRKPGIYTVIKDIDLFMVDEVHSLGDEGRGGELDGAITRFLMSREKDSVQCLFLSATFDNVDTMVRYFEQFHSKLNVVNIAFSPIVRHIAEIKTYRGGKGANEQALFDMVREIKETHGDGGILGLMYSRKGVEAVANMLNAEYNEGDSIFALHHNAGLPREARQMAEESFRNGRIKALIASPTIAMGVNLPGQSIGVVACMFDPYKKETRILPKHAINQIVGRAGRPPFFKEAYVHLAVEASLLDDLKAEMDKPMLVIGQMIKVLDSVVNTEVFKTPGLKAEELYKILTHSYSFLSLDIPEDIFKAKFKDEILYLHENKFIAIDNTGKLFPTPRGAACAMYMQRPKFVEHAFNVFGNNRWIDEVQAADWSDENIISLVCQMYDNEYSPVKVKDLDKDMENMLSFNWITGNHGSTRIEWARSAPEYPFVSEIRDDLERFNLMLVKMHFPTTKGPALALDYMKKSLDKGGVPMSLVRLAKELDRRGVKGVGNKRLFVLALNGVTDKDIVRGSLPEKLRCYDSFSSGHFLRGIEPYGECDDDKLERIYSSAMWSQHRSTLIGGK